MLIVWFISYKTKIALHIIHVLNIIIHKFSLNSTNLV